MPKTVTLVTLLIGLSASGCHVHRTPESRAVNAGLTQLDALNRTEGELNARFAIELKPRVVDGRETGFGVAANGRDYRWHLVSPARRKEAKALLERYIREANEVLLIGLANRKVVLTDPEVIVARRDAAQSFLDHLRGKESAFDATFEPKATLTGRELYEHSVDL